MATSLKYILTIGFSLYCLAIASAQCKIHPNFRSIANMQGLKATYEIQFTILSTQIDGTQHTTRGLGTICKQDFEDNCSKQISLQMQSSDKRRDKESCRISIDFVKNHIAKQEGRHMKIYSNIQRSANNFYVTAMDGTILTFSFIKYPLCID